MNQKFKPFKQSLFYRTNFNNFNCPHQNKRKHKHYRIWNVAPEETRVLLDRNEIPHHQRQVDKRKTRSQNLARYQKRKATTCHLFQSVSVDDVNLGDKGWYRLEISLFQISRDKNLKDKKKKVFP